MTLKVNPFVPVTNISGVPTSEYVGYSVFLNGTVEPADASSKTIEWSVVDAGDTGATISKSKLTATAAGTAIIRATIKYGSVGPSDYTQDFEFNFKNVIAVKSLEDCPNRTIAGVPLPLSATVVPEDATFQTVVWDITNAEGTGARIVGNVLYTTNPGIVRVLVNVIDHKGYSVYHVNYGILVDAHVPVTDISDVPASAYIGIDLPLSGTINPSTASFKAIEWSVVNPGETGATISGNTLKTTAAGTAIIRATVKYGGTGASDYTQDFTINVAPYIPVANISGVPTSTIAGVDLPLTATIEPAEASNKAITWSVADAGTTGATISGSTLKTTAAGTAIIRATVKNGLTPTSEYTQEFQVNVTPLVKVTGIANLPDKAFEGEALTLTGTVLPIDASFQTIAWSIIDPGTTGATISGDTLYTTGAGTAIIRATVKKGLSPSTDYTKDFQITVDAFVPVTNIRNVPDAATAGVDMPLYGAITEPENATNKSITWSVVNAGTTGATIPGGKLRTTDAGNAVIRATVIKGASPSSDYTQDFTVTVSAPVPVEAINFNFSGPYWVNQPVVLDATVVPNNATYNGITWGLAGDRSNATIMNGILYFTGPGSPTLVATISNGKITSDFVKEVTLEVNTYTAVSRITGVPNSALAGVPRNLSSASVEPANASYKSITWSVVSAGTTGATISDDTLYTTGSGTATIRATIQNGQNTSTDYTEDFTVNVETPVAVTGINFDFAKPSYTVGVPVPLEATVVPANASFTTIEWSVEGPDAHTAYISDNVLHFTAPGSPRLVATIKNGKITEDYETSAILQANAHTPVDSITGVPDSAAAGFPLTLSGTVTPVNASFSSIIWSVVNPGTTGATLSGNTLNTTGGGTVTIRATIKNGLTATSDYTQDFTITVTTFVPVTNITGIPGTSIAHNILNLNGTVEPANATNKTITWSVADAGTTEGKIGDDGKSFSATNGGTAIIRATIKNGLGPSTDYTKDFPIDVLVATTNIIDTPHLNQLVGTPVPLTGSVVPQNATYKTIEWLVEDPRGSGAYIEDNVLYTTSPGHPIVVGTIRNGKITGDFTSSLYFVIQPIPVTGITGIPTSITVGEPLTLSGAVNEDATYKTILWSVVDPGTTGATLSEGTLNTTGSGTATIRATIKDGKALDDNYTQDFRIKVLPVMSEDTLMDTVGSTTIIAEGYFAPYAELEVTELPSGDADREELEELMGEKQILGAFEARITPADSYQPPLTLTFNVGAKYNGSMVYVLHRLESGETEQFTTTVTGGVVRIIVNELSPFLIAKDLPLSISSQPKSVRAAVGQTVSFSVWATGEPPLSYQWQRKKSGGSWKNIDGATAPDFTIDQVTLAMDGVKYRVIVTDGLGNRVTSSAATLTVNKVSSPDTGDHAQPALYALLAALFAVALVMLLKKRRTT